MKKLFPIILITLLSCNNNYIDCDSDLNYKNGMTYLKGKKYNGDCYTYFKNDSLKSKQSYLNGLDNGEWVYYFNNGQMETYGRFESGKRIGEWLYFYENGNLNQISYYKKGLRDSLWKKFDLNNQIIWEKKFRLDSIVEQITYKNYQ